MGTVWNDLRYGLRTLRKNPGFTTVAVLTLALGIGATTLIFSVIDNLLLRPFPYKNADRYTTLFIWNLDREGDGRGILHIPEFFDYREQNHVFEDMIGYGGANIIYKAIQGTEELDGAYVTGNTFQFLGVKPLWGRGLTPEDANPASPPVFVMNYRLWKNEFNGERKLLGSTLTLNDEPMTLVGIMPPRFQYADASIWLPLRVGRGGPTASDVNMPRDLFPLGLRKPGVSLRAAASDLIAIGKRLSKNYPGGYSNPFTVTTDTLADSEVGHFKTLLYILLAAVMMLLLIACSNVANLLLARATARQREIAVRAAVGASRCRLMQQLLVESFMLAAAGGLLGWFLAYGSLKGVVAAIPEGTIPSSAVIGLNAAVLLFAMGVTMLTTLLCGLTPALHAVGGDLDARLREAARGLNAGPLRGRLRQGLVIVEVALSIVLLVGAGLMMRTFFALERVDLGFKPQDILHAQVELLRRSDHTAQRQKMVLQEILDRVRALPGVTAASVNVSIPPNMGGPNDNMIVLGQTFSKPRDAMFNLASTDYFKTLGLPLIRGRLLSESDIDSARLVAVINQTLARDFFGKDDPIGQKIKFVMLDRVADAPHNAFFEIIGVVGDAKNDGLRSTVLPEAFLPYSITVVGPRILLVRIPMGGLSLLPSVQRAVSSVAPDVALTNTGSIKTLLNSSAYAQPRFGLLTLAIFAGLGLVLVAIGVFSVMSYSISLRKHEIGIRMALGASRSTVLQTALLEGLRLIVVGIVLGEGASFALRRLIASQLWGVSPADPLTLGSVAVVIVTTGLLACLFPARRATKVDPMVALRYE
jgi:putative ABC transport system permease protein